MRVSMSGHGSQVDSSERTGTEILSLCCFKFSQKRETDQLPTACHDVTLRDEPNKQCNVDRAYILRSGQWIQQGLLSGIDRNYRT